MLFLLPLVAPLMLLGLLLLMERVERPLGQGSVGDDLQVLFETSLPDELETYVRDGVGTSLDRYWRRRRAARLLAERLGIPG